MHAWFIIAPIPARRPGLEGGRLRQTVPNESNQCSRLLARRLQPLTLIMEPCTTSRALSSLLYFHTPTRSTSLAQTRFPRGDQSSNACVSLGSDFDHRIDPPSHFPFLVPLTRSYRPIFPTGKIRKKIPPRNPHQLPRHAGVPI